MFSNEVYRISSRVLTEWTRAQVIFSGTRRIDYFVVGSTTPKQTSSKQTSSKQTGSKQTGSKRTSSMKKMLLHINVPTNCIRKQLNML